MNTKVIAHRGFSAKAPENTLAAFQWAIKTKADGIELDVHLTLDGEVVVIHDEKIDRTTTGQGWIKDFTIAELRQFQNGVWFSEEYSDQIIPTLDEVLELASNTELLLNIELKNNVIFYSGLEETVVHKVEHFGLEKQVVISSFNHTSLAYLHQFRPNWSIAALYEEHLYKPWIYAKTFGASALHPIYTVVTEEMIEQCNQHGILVRPYTVNCTQDMKRFVDLQVDAIITDFPDQLYGLLQEKAIEIS
jgi:glycerophosphoryl diester phosphodiesterase